MPASYRRPERRNDLVSIFAVMPWWIVPLLVVGIDAAIVVVVCNAKIFPSVPPSC